MSYYLTNFKIKDLKIEIQFNADNVIDINFNGVMLADANKKVEHYINRIRKQILSHNIKKINIDFTQLKYMNSSGLKIIIRWLKENEDSTNKDRYIVKLYYDKNISWQELSFSNIIALFPNSMIEEGK